MKCKCWEIEAKIRAKYPEADWNMDESCKEWRELSERLDYEENIEREAYACTCPTCGRSICGWCV